MPAAGAAKRKAVLSGLMLLVLSGLGALWWTGLPANGSGTQIATPEAAAQQDSEAMRPPGGLLRVDHAEPGTVDAVSAPAVSLRPAGVEQATENATQETALTEAERLRQSLDRLEREDRLRTAELGQQRVARAQEQRRAEQARRRAEAVATTVAAPVEERAVVAAAEVAPKPAVMQPPTPVTTVESICAGSGNFFARDLCRLRECGKVSFAGDSTCVRFREMEEARRRDLAN